MDEHHGDEVCFCEQLTDENARLRAVADAVEAYLAGGRSTAGLRGLYAAREALTRDARGGES